MLVAWMHIEAMNVLLTMLQWIAAAVIVWLVFIAVGAFAAKKDGRDSDHPL